MHTDMGPQFRSTKWRNLCQLHGIKLTRSGVEHHNALRVGERYHTFLRQVYRKVKAEHPDFSKMEILEIAVKVVNDTAGPNGLVPTLLVFGVMPRIPITPVDLPAQRERMQALSEARRDMAKHFEEKSVNRALRYSIPQGTMSYIQIDDEVLVYREGPNTWEGPHKVTDISRKMIQINKPGPNCRFSIDKVNKYKATPDITEDKNQDVTHTIPTNAAQ